MTKAGKIALGAATLWPFVYFVVFFVFVFAMMFAFSGRDPAAVEEPPAWFFGIFVLHFLTMLWVVGLMVIYIINVFRNERVEKDKKALWAVVLFLGNMLAMPVYWYLYIWSEPPALPPTPGGAR